ncbi:MAG: Na+/H+ antiporter subunit E [Chloroflexia bacterium]|jgi:multisubunit Na+/H+ antiporter MnhE subunit|nr:Na+/H+ antiporter subunit E [Chloroflexia bacterium]MDQ3613896.1 Na+/H+ antiporter subunit E [Chloroflexota bacterium]
MILIAVVLMLLTAVYSMTLASLAWEDLALGLGLSAILLFTFRGVLLPSPLPPAGQTLRAVAAFPAFAFIAFTEIVKGSWQVATIVVGIRPLANPGIVEIPIMERTPTAVGLSGLILTLSPGSFLVDVKWDERVMLIHVIDATDPEAIRAGYVRFYERYQRALVP